MRQMGTRNRTRCEEGGRKVTEGLVEIDRVATRADTRNLEEQEKNNLDVYTNGGSMEQDSSVLGRTCR